MGPGHTPHTNNYLWLWANLQKNQGKKKPVSYSYKRLDSIDTMRFKILTINNTLLPLDGIH